MVHNEKYSQQRDLISGISQKFLECKYKLVYSTQLQIMVLCIYRYMWKCWYMLIFFLHRCPTYNNLPKGCYEVKKAGQCCPTVQCENGVLLTSTNNLGTIGSGGLISVLHPPVPQAVPTLPSGGQPLPGTGGTGFMAPSLSKSKFMKGFELELPKTMLVYMLKN